VVKLKYAQALEDIFESGLIENEENSRAIATHLLDTPEVKPPLLGQFEYEELCQLIGVAPTSATMLNESDPYILNLNL